MGKKAMDLLLGIDIGTTGCKSVFYSTEGIIAAEGYREYEIQFPYDGWAEMDPDQWWDGVCASTREALASLKEDHVHVLGICISCANAIIPVDREGRHLWRAVMQVDSRSREQTNRAAELIPQKTFLKKTGNFVRTGGFSPSFMLWLKEHFRDIYDQTYKFLAPSGYIVQKMTGNFTIDYSRASTAALMDINTLKWSDDICSTLDIDIEKLPELFLQETTGGKLSSGAARAMGLEPDIPVAVGLMDSTAAMIGSGCISENTVSLVLGTVSRLCCPMTEPNFHESFLNAFFLEGVPYLAMAPTNGGGLSFRWFANSFGDYEKSLAETMRVNFYELFDHKASQIQAGCGGLLYLPYILGERSPVWDPNARGVFFGINSTHTKAHFVRSILEGVGHATLQNLQLIERELHGFFNEIVITGGGAKSKIWCEIMSNMLNKCIVRLGHSDCETKGAAFVAGLMTGVYHSYSDVMRQIHIKDYFHPNETASESYLPLHDVYKSLYSHLKDDFTSLAKITQAAASKLPNMAMSR